MVMGLGLSKLNGVILLGLIFVSLVVLMLVVLLNTQVGLALRATGDNLAMGEANGIKVDRMKILGYMISNGLIALSGALLAQIWLCGYEYGYRYNRKWLGCNHLGLRLSLSIYHLANVFGQLLSELFSTVWSWL